MRCPDCGGETKVIDTAVLNKKNKTRRRRLCLSCGSRNTTYEEYRPKAR